jgi:WD40 repeat protein
MRDHEVVPDVGPEPRDAGPMRSRAGRPSARRWPPGRIALLVSAAVGLPWLPAFDLPTEGPPLQWARGRSALPIRGLAFRPDGRTIATIDERGRVRLRPAVEGEGIERDVDVGFVKAMAFSPDGRYLAIGRDEPDVVLCDLDRVGHARPLGIPVEMTSDLSFSSDGRTLAVSSHSSGAIHLWDLRAGRPRMTLEGRSSSVMAVAFAPDGRSLASADYTGIVLWDLATGRPRHRLAGPSVRVPSLAYSPDGHLLAAVDLREHSVRVWDLRTGGQIRRIVGQSFPIRSAAFSPDGRLLATAAGDGFARLWDVADGRELRRLDGQAPYLRHVAFSPDGRTLAATGNDDDIRLWDLNGLIEGPGDSRLPAAGPPPR